MINLVSIILLVIGIKIIRKNKIEEKKTTFLRILGIILTILGGFGVLLMIYLSIWSLLYKLAI